MSWYDWDDPGPWKKHRQHVELLELQGGIEVEPLIPNAAIIAAAEQVAEDNHSMAHMETDHIQITAHTRVAEAFEAFAKMLKTGENM